MPRKQPKDRTSPDFPAMYKPGTPDDAYQRQLRDYFLEAIALNPLAADRVLGRLRDDVLIPLFDHPKVVTISLEQDGPFPPNQDGPFRADRHLRWSDLANPRLCWQPSHHSLREALLKWGEICHLTDEWTLSAALETVQRWAGVLRRLIEHGNLAWVRMNFGVKVPLDADIRLDDSGLSAMEGFDTYLHDLKQFAEDNIGKAWSGLFIEEMPEWDGNRDTAVWDDLMDQPMSWDPDRESEESFDFRIERYKAKRIAQAQASGARETPGTRRAGKSDWQTRLDWVVCFQVLGQSYVPIGAHAGAKSDAVRKSILRLAREMGLTLRDRK